MCPDPGAPAVRMRRSECNGLPRRVQAQPLNLQPLRPRPGPGGAGAPGTRRAPCTSRAKARCVACRRSTSNGDETSPMDARGSAPYGSVDVLAAGATLAETGSSPAGFTYPSSSPAVSGEAGAATSLTAALTIRPSRAASWRSARRTDRLESMEIPLTMVVSRMKPT